MTRHFVLVSVFLGALSSVGLNAQEVAFLRGDCDSDTLVGISDALFNVNYLYLGGDNPFCLDACDADDSGFLSIFDALFVLNYLFSSGRSPLPPFPEQRAIGFGLNLDHYRFHQFLFLQFYE